MEESGGMTMSVISIGPVLMGSGLVVAAVVTPAKLPTAVLTVVVGMNAATPLPLNYPVVPLVPAIPAVADPEVPEVAVPVVPPIVDGDVPVVIAAHIEPAAQGMLVPGHKLVAGQAVGPGAGGATAQ